MNTDEQRFLDSFLGLVLSMKELRSRSLPKPTGFYEAMDRAEREMNAAIGALYLSMKGGT